LVAAMAEALLLPLGVQQPELGVLHSLGQGPTLLILDNFETPWEADTVEVEAWLGSLSEVPGLCMLVTVRGVQRPMLAHWHKTVEPRRLDVGTSVQLFNDLAGKDFSSDVHLQQLLEAVDHVPLAITLLAPLAEGEPDLSGLWARWLHERTRLLQRAGGQDRLTNLELSYELSWCGPRMTDLARQLLQRLALLPSGVAHQDLQHLLPREVESSVSLLRKVGLAYDEAGRLRLLAPLREAILRRHPLDSDALRTISGRWLKRAIQQARMIGRKGGAPAINLLAAEVANVEAMVLLCRELDVLKQLIGPWSRFQRSSGHGSMVLVDHVIALADKRDPTLGARASVEKGRIAWFRSQDVIASQCYERAFSVFKQTGDMRGQATCLHLQGEVARAQSDHVVARNCYEQALNLFTQAGDLHGQANCLQSQGELARMQSDHAFADKCYEQALKLFNQVGDLQGKANCYQSQGEAARARSDHAFAGQCYEQALNLYTQIGDLIGNANTLQGQGELARVLSNNVAARQHYEQALTLYTQIGDLHGQANCLHGHGDLACAQSDYAVASRYYENALYLYEQTSDLLGRANCFLSQADLACVRSDHAVASQFCEQALNLYEQIGDFQGQANCLQTQGELARMQSDHAVASKCYAQALNLFNQAGDLQGQATCLQSQSELARARMDFAVSGQCHEQAANIYEQIGDLHGQANCTRVRGSLFLDEQQLTFARQRFEEAYQGYKRFGDFRGQAYALIEMGHAETAQNNFEAAANAWRATLNVADEQVIPLEMGIAHVLLARNVSATERENHVQAAARAWRGVDLAVLKGKAWWYRVDPAECEAVIAAS
jgi:tetratricopeptide (TPR) repeat protein